jgi:hypothetical protein
MLKLPLEQAIARMRASAAYHRDRVKPHRPLLRLPEGVIDVTNEQAGKTLAIVGAPADWNDL